MIHYKVVGNEAICLMSEARHEVDYLPAVQKVQRTTLSPPYPHQRGLHNVIREMSKPVST